MGSEKENPINVITNFKIKKSGLFDFEGLFNEIKEFFSRYKYHAVEKSHTEKKGSSGMYLESNWKASKKVTDYVKFSIDVSILLRDLTEVFVELPNGDKVKKNKGRIEIVFNAKMEKDYDKKFSDNKKSFSYFLRTLYERYIIKNKLENYEGKLYTETTDLISSLKNYFD